VLSISTALLCLAFSSKSPSCSRTLINIDKDRLSSLESLKDECPDRSEKKCSCHKCKCMLQKE